MILRLVTNCELQDDLRGILLYCNRCCPTARSLCFCILSSDEGASGKTVAVGVGSNVKKRTRAVRLALALAMAVASPAAPSGPMPPLELSLRCANVDPATIGSTSHPTTSPSRSSVVRNDGAGEDDPEIIEAMAATAPSSGADSHRRS